MPEEVRNRIKQVRKTLNISQRAFAKRVYISQSLLGDMELGYRNINNRIIHLISSEFNISKNWLMTGEGQMFDGPVIDVQLENLVEIFNQLDKNMKDYLLAQSKGLLKMQQEKINK
jgi:transcriptional regulator with XRE-family HTH domain